MAVKLDHLPDGVVVLHGVDTPAALRHLSRSMREGTAFENYRGMVVDLDGTHPDEHLMATLDEAVAACLRRRQVIAFAEDDGGAQAGTDFVRRTLQLLERERMVQTAIDLARVQIEVLAGTATAVIQLAAGAARAAGSVGSRALRRLVTSNRGVLK